MLAAKTTPKVLHRSAPLNGFLEQFGIFDILNGVTYANVTEVVINRPGELWLESDEGWKVINNEALTYDVCLKFANAFAVFNKQNATKATPIISGVFPTGQRGQVVIPTACESDTVSIVVRKPSTARFTVGDYIATGRLENWRDVSDFIAPETIQPSNIIDADQLKENERDYARLVESLQIPGDVKLQLFELQMLEAKANRDVTRFLELAVKHKSNMVLVGATGSGKTTFTKAICDMVPSETRIITIEDTAELDLPLHPNRVHLFYGEHVEPRELLKSCLRMKPDRIFLTELRGDEALEYLSALNTGHGGSITTVHANDCQSAYFRIGTLIKQTEVGMNLDMPSIMEQVYTTLDVMMFLEHTKLKEIAYDPIRKYRLLKGQKL